MLKVKQIMTAWGLWWLQPFMGQARGVLLCDEDQGMPVAQSDLCGLTSAH